MNIISSYDENDYYDFIDDANCINDYDGVKDYYADYYGDIDDDDELMVEITEKKSQKIIIKKAKGKHSPFNNLTQIFGMKFHFNHILKNH